MMKLVRTYGVWFVMVGVAVTLTITAANFFRNDTLQVHIDGIPERTPYFAVSFARPYDTEQSDENFTPWVFTEPQSANISLGPPPTWILVPAKDLIEITPYGFDEGTTCILTTNSNDAEVTIVGAGATDGTGWFPSAVVTTLDNRQSFTALTLNERIIVPAFSTGRVEIRTGNCPIQTNFTLERGWNWLSYDGNNETPSLTAVTNVTRVELLKSINTTNTRAGGTVD